MSQPVRRDVASPWPFVGMGTLACALFLYGASVLAAPWWAVGVLAAVWLVLFVTACRWFTPYPKRVAFLGAFAVVFWFAFVLAGGVLLDWDPVVTPAD